MAAKKVEELRTEPIDVLLERLINKNCMGLEVYYAWAEMMAQVLNETPTGMVQEVRLMIQVTLMCKRKALGEFFYAGCAIDLVPIEAFAERGIQSALEDLRNQRMQETSFLNGGPTQSLKDRPQH